MNRGRIRTWTSGEWVWIVGAGLFVGVSFNVAFHAGPFAFEGLAGGVLGAVLMRALV